MSNIKGFWYPDRGAPKDSGKKGKVRVSGSITLKMEAKGKTNTTIKYKTSGIEDFGKWFARQFPSEAKTLIASLKEGLNE